jgi:lysine 2,3-aminomutase
MKLHFESAGKPESVASESWSSWTWQLQQSLKSESQFSRQFRLSDSEKTAFQKGQDIFSVRATPYYARLARDLAEDPIRKILMPSKLEFQMGAQAMLDPLGERKNNPVARIIHRYPDRALFLVTDICSVYCRYCTRKHFTGQEQAFIKADEFENALGYLRMQTGIREVILSGGDPLTLSDQHLEKVLSALREIEHIEIIRIGTRMPVVCPMRATKNLVSVLRKHKPVFLMTHFNHPRELTAEAAEGLELFVDHGIPVFNQMVLLNGINNHAAIVQALSRRLLYLRVKPYYMFQCDPSEGTDHLRTSIENSLEIQAQLWGNLSGLAMPNLSLDIPHGGGKVGLVPDFKVSEAASHRVYRGWDGIEQEYKNPEVAMQIPIDVQEYLPEWNQLRAAKDKCSYSGQLKPDSNLETAEC